MMDVNKIIEIISRHLMNFNGNEYFSSSEFEACVESAAQEIVAQQSGDDVCPSCGVADWVYGDSEQSVIVCAICGEKRL